MFDIRGLFGNRLDTDQILEMFRQTIAEELQGHQLRTSSEDPLAFELTRLGSDEAALSLNAHNVVREILANGYGRADAGRRIAQFAGMIAAALAPEKVDARAIYLAFRHYDYAASAEVAALRSHGLGDLRLVIAEDRGAYVSLPSDKALAAAGLSFEEARDIARDNYMSTLSRMITDDDGDGVTSVTLEGYEWLSASLLLTPPVLQGIARKNGCENVLIATPAVDTLYLVDAARPEAAELLRTRMVESRGASRVQSLCVFHMAAQDKPRLRVAYTLQFDKLVAAN